MVTYHEFQGMKSADAEPFRLIFFTEILGKKVYGGSVKNKIGKVADLTFKKVEPYPEIAGILIEHGWGKPTEHIPWEKFIKFDEGSLFVQPSETVYPPLKTDQGLLLINENLMGRTIFDMDDRRIEVVNDVHLLSSHGRMLLVHVDTSFNGFLRSWGLGKLNLAKEKLIPWKYVQPISMEDPDSKDVVKLSIPRAQLEDIPAEDLADALEELSGGEQTAVFSALDSETAAEVLTNAEPRAQRQLIANLRKERASNILSEMSTPQLVALFSVLPHDQVTSMLELLPKEEADRIRILAKTEDLVARAAMTSEFVTVSGSQKTKDVLSLIKTPDRTHESISYLYVVAPDNTVLGVVDLRDLVLAKDDVTMEELMSVHVVSIQDDDPLEDLAELFAKYHYRMIPVVDQHDKILGVIHYNDIMKGLVTRPIY